MNKFLSILSIWFLVGLQSIPAQQLAFPGAEGAGMYTVGGRYGDVYHVTNLNNSGSGSIREGVETASEVGRTIVFDVSGNISLSSSLKITKPHLTIAGQTAPGKGICLKDGRVTVSGNDIIIRHLRFRPSQSGGDGDALNISGTNIIIDHCSASWSSDEVMSTAENANNNITLQWNLIYEGLNISYHYENGVLLDHSMGSLLSTSFDGGIISCHHNLYAHNRTRNPKPTVSAENIAINFDFRNNVIYDWGDKAGYSSDDSLHFVNMNYIGNYLIAGSSTKASKCTLAFNGITSGTHIFQSENKIDGNRDKLLNGINTEWNMFEGEYKPMSTAYILPEIKTVPADSAYPAVLKYGGAFWWNRDSADARIASEVQSETGSIINLQSDVGGWENLPTLSRSVTWDTDKDGMPDTWEADNGLNPDSNGDASLLCSDGYTNLEHYINGIIPSMTTDIASSESGRMKISKFVLHNNYPNPFNPGTTISYAIPQQGRVRIRIFNDLGKEVSVVCNEIQEAGVHHRYYDASTLPNGVYFYQVEFDNYLQSKKMVLLK
jgi:hypothetical protein